jgi:hypothetical protein
MIKYISYVIVLFFINSCSLKSPPNEWYYKSLYSYNSYIENFLSQNDTLANNNLSNAVSYAKKSADLSILGKIYLGKCALEISVGIDSKCNEYLNISDLTNDTSLIQYYYLITKNYKNINTEHIDKKYQAFAIYNKNNDLTNAKNEIFKMEKPTSTLISAFLIKDQMSYDDIQKLIDIASYNGYKKSVIFWLNEMMLNSQNKNEKYLLQKKINILNTKD